MILSAIPFRLIFPVFNSTPLDSFVLDLAVAFFLFLSQVIGSSYLSFNLITLSFAFDR